MPLVLQLRLLVLIVLTLRVARHSHEVVLRILLWLVGDVLNLRWWAQLPRGLHVQLQILRLLLCAALHLMVLRLVVL